MSPFARGVASTLLVLGLGSACGSGASGAEKAVLHSQAAGAEARLIERMVDAPLETAYAGTRRIELRFELAGKERELAYREAVGADGEGRFGIRTLEVLSPHPDAELFLILQDARQGFSYRFRDFQIRDLEAFRRNYGLEVAAEPVEVAGVACSQMLVRPRKGATFWRVAVDPESGLVLRWEQYRSDRRLLGRMEFETFERGAPSPGMALRDGWAADEPLDLDAASLGFPLLLPARPPEGFELEGVARVTDELGRVWARLLYGDGVRRLAFMHRARSAAAEAGEPTAGLVRHMQLGAWNVATGELDGVPVLVVGQVADEELFGTLQSAVF